MRFIHITDKKNGGKIERNGIRGNVYCFPVLSDFNLTHQWARELKRGGSRSLICIQFYLPDDVIVSVGKYGREKLDMKASEVVAFIAHQEDPFGMEVVVSGRVEPNDITRVYDAPRVTGWRYYPLAKGLRPLWGKRANKGEIKAKRLRDE